MSTFGVAHLAIPERLHMLSQSLKSVTEQTRKFDQHVIHLDHQKHGVATSMNRALAGLDTTFVCPLADDDYLEPLFLELLAPHCENADVVHSWCRLDGDPKACQLILEGNRINQPLDWEFMQHTNQIPSTALIRRELALESGFYEDVANAEDWLLWKRMHDAGARFHQVPRALWVYRFGHGQTAQRSIRRAPNGIEKQEEEGSGA